MIAPQICLFLALAASLSIGQGAPPRPVVQTEEDIYSHEPANNGAGPMWCHGSTCLVRLGDDLFATGLETLPRAKPLNNCRWMLFHRGPQGWHKVHTDTSGRTREPSPLAGFADGRLFVSANPTLNTDPDAYAGPARPEIFQFTARDPSRPPEKLIPTWSGQPPFTEHSYRSFAADGPNAELILFQNVGYTHAEWTFLDRDGRWSAHGQLKWPWGADYAKPQPIRVCYPNVALRNRQVHFCGVSDITEPNPAWRAYKQKLTGQQWDYDFRRLFYTWSPDITTGRFEPWIEVAGREKTCGWITPGDLWVAPDGHVHLLWSERAIDERLREEFSPMPNRATPSTTPCSARGKSCGAARCWSPKRADPTSDPDVGAFTPRRMAACSCSFTSPAPTPRAKASRRTACWRFCPMAPSAHPPGCPSTGRLETS